MKAVGAVLLLASLGALPARAETWPVPVEPAHRARLEARHGCEGGAMIAGICEPANNVTLVEVQGPDDLAALPLLPGLDRVNIAATLDMGALTDDQWRSLAQLPRLRRLSLSNNALADLAPITRLRGLQSLNIAGTAVSDLTPLAAMTGLRALNLDRTSVADLTPLRSLVALDRLVLPDGTILFDHAEVSAFLQGLR
ncbi:leucine-rich repeat domain-containing protein [Gemmobacter caeruleus]|uniref:leucine-rich repeat domain-containing protein n=1 Tax=Gemmobacter caeruleus TaxID=2595004 RepID=UPI0011ECFD7E|nr:leucine-rich repeat domain-containing protein [Gemmobacter caeruleus]